MAFLQIDGLTIPVDTKSPRRRFEEIGAFSRSVGGSGLFGIRSAKRSWDVSTTPMSHDDAEAIAALLSGRGLWCPFLASSPNPTNGYVPPATAGLVYGGAFGGWRSAFITTTAGYLQLADSTHNPFSGYGGALSFNVWVYRAGATAGYVLKGTGGDVFIYVNAAGAMAAGLSALQVGGSIPALTTWYMLTLVIVSNGDGTVRTELWVNGSLANSNTSAAWAVSYVDPSSLTDLFLGSDLGGAINRFNGNILQPMFVPGRLTQRWISALYNAGNGVYLGSWPQHRVTGTIVGSGALNTFVRNISAEPVDAPGLVAAERLTFTLSEA